MEISLSVAGQVIFDQHEEASGTHGRGSQFATLSRFWVEMAGTASFAVSAAHMCPQTPVS